MKNRIIIVEGLPSTGKSTTAKYIAENLNIKFVDESDENHPADYVYRAFINNKILKKLGINYIVIESDYKNFNKSYKKIMSCIENYSRK